MVSDANLPQGVLILVGHRLVEVAGESEDRHIPLDRRHLGHRAKGALVGQQAVKQPQAVEGVLQVVQDSKTTQYHYIQT